MESLSPAQLQPPPPIFLYAALQTRDDPGRVRREWVAGWRSGWGWWGGTGLECLN